MKKIYLFISPLVFFWGSCSVDDVLDSSEELNLSVIETNNPIKAEPGDTVVFQFVASTSKGELSRVEITTTDNIQPIVKNVSFAMIDENRELTLNQEGYFSRPVSTVLVKYPLVIPANETLRGKQLSIDLKVTRDDGKVKVLNQGFEIIKYINNRYGITMTGKNFAWIYNPVEDIVYDMDNYKSHLSQIDIILYVDGNSKYYCLNPAAAKTEKIMHDLGYADYRATEMNTTKFMGGVTLNFALVTENELAGLVVSDGVDELVMGNNAVCGFLTESGRKGFAKHLYKSPNRMFVTKMQLTAD